MGFLCVSESLRLMPAVGDNTVSCPRPSPEDRADARAPRASQLGRSGEGGCVLSETVRANGDEDHVQRLRGGQDGERLSAVHESQCSFFFFKQKTAYEIS